MNFKRPDSTRRLGGASKKEATRGELLQKAKTEREARREVISRQKSAVVIQSAWRSWRVRNAVLQDMCSTWLAKYGKVTADVNAVLPACELSERVLPPILFALLGAGATNRRAGLFSGDPLRQISQPLAAPLRASMALLLRSCASTDGTSNFLSLVRHPACRARCLSQIRQIILVCAASLAPGGTSGDVLLEMAASRLLAVLTDVSQWRCFEPGDPASASAAAEVLQFCGSSPALACAVRRLIEGGTVPAASERPANPSRSPSATEGPAAPQTLGSVPPQPSPPSAVQQHATVLQAVLPALLRASVWTAVPGPTTATSPTGTVTQALTASGTTHGTPLGTAEGTGVLDIGQDTESGVCGTSGRSPGSSGVGHFIRKVLTVPGMASSLPAPQRKLLESASVIRPCLHVLSGVGESKSGVACDHTEGLAWDERVWIFANITLLFAGEMVSKTLEGGRTVVYMQRSQLLEVPGLAGSYVEAGIRLLSTAKASAARGRSSAAYPASLSDAAGALWPLSEAALLGPLVTLQMGQEDPATMRLLLFLHLLLEVLPDLATAAGDPPEQLTMRYVSGLAFGSGILGKLWRYLAVQVGLPLEAPAQATRGWDIAALRNGAAGLDPFHVTALTLFSRVYAHLLLVLDDEDFYQRQDMFTLAQQRAIATAFNTLVFRTHRPASPPPSSPSASSGAAQTAQTAPLSLVEGLSRAQPSPAPAAPPAPAGLLSRLATGIASGISSRQAASSTSGTTSAAPSRRNVGIIQGGASRDQTGTTAPFTSRTASGTTSAAAAGSIPPQPATNSQGSFHTATANMPNSSIWARDSTADVRITSVSSSSPSSATAFGPFFTTHSSPRGSAAVPYSPVSARTGASAVPNSPVLARSAASSVPTSPVLARRDANFGNRSGSSSTVVTTSVLPYPGFDQAEARAALARWAAVLLRALYERDVRRSYCPPALWLAPFQATDSASKEEREASLTAAVVLRGLLSFADATDGGTDQFDALLPGKPGLRAKPHELAQMLNEAPHCIPFEDRVHILRSLVAADKQRSGEERSAPIQLTLRRGSLLEDAYAALRNAGPSIKRRLAVQFVSKDGVLEAGLDHGGLTKEFLEEVIRDGFAAERGLMTATAEGRVYPHPAAFRLGNNAALLELLGLLFGKAIYEGILVDAPFAPFFVAVLQGRRPVFDDLASLDPDLHRSLAHLKRYEGNVEELALDFTLEEEVAGQRRAVELRPGGASIAVTDQNKLLYIHLAADWHLNGKLGVPAAAFASGLNQVIPPHVAAPLQFRWEVNQLAGGRLREGGLDVEDKCAPGPSTSGGYSEDSSAVKMFWKVVGEMDLKQRAALLKFVTSVSRPPLGGFEHLRPPLTIHQVSCSASPFSVIAGQTCGGCPTAATCSNMLKPTPTIGAWPQCGRS
eukprot:jgi/Botrbrau1/20597/Bobra.113_1s0023.1